MEYTSGSPKVKIGLIDGPVDTRHPDLEGEHLKDTAESNGTCAASSSLACLHGTFIAGILAARRSSQNPGICPNCTLLLRPVFAEGTSKRGQMPSATPTELAAAITECIEAGARVINLSLGLAQPSTGREQSLEAALNQAVRRGVLVAAAAGNQGTIGSSAITRHPWVIPVVACNLRGRPINESNLASSIGKRGLSAPGDRIEGLAPDGRSLTLGGTSVAVPFVTGATALLCSAFPSATAAQIKLAITQASTRNTGSLVPPLLNGASAYHILSTTITRR
jgi:subtilisin family serine protease